MADDLIIYFPTASAEEIRQRHRLAAARDRAEESFWHTNPDTAPRDIADTLFRFATDWHFRPSATVEELTEAVSICESMWRNFKHTKRLEEGARCAA